MLGITRPKYLLSADHLLAVESLRKGSKRGVEDTSTKAEDKMEGWLLLDVVIGQGSAVLQLLAGEDQSLLIWGNSFLILNLLFDIVNRVRGLDLEGDGFAREGLHEDLYTTNKFDSSCQSNDFSKKILNDYSGITCILPQCKMQPRVL